MDNSPAAREIAVLGGTGFLGRHICEAFQARKTGVAVISYRPDYGFLAKHAPLSVAHEIGSDAAFDALKQAKVILYFGHRSRPASNVAAGTYEIEQNIRPAIELCSFLEGAGSSPSVVYASSGGQIYGLGHTGPIPETAPSAPVTPYGLGKQLIEDALRYYARKGVLRATILRMGNPVGHWQLGGRHGLVAVAVMAALRQAPVTLFGAGDNVRDYFDARDLALFVAALALGGAPPEGTFNIGSGSGWTETQILKVVGQTLQCEIAIERQPARPFDLPYAVLDVASARGLLGWSPATTLEHTIMSLRQKALEAGA